MLTVRPIATIPLLQGPYEWAVLQEAEALVFLGPDEHVAYSMLDGRRLWQKCPAPGASGRRGGAVNILGSNLRVLVLQDIDPGRGVSGVNRGIEGIDIQTGDPRWRVSPTPPTLGWPGPAIDSHVYAPTLEGSLKVSLENGRWETAVGVRAWREGPGGWFGIHEKCLVCFDGTATGVVCKAPKRALAGIAGRYAVLTDLSKSRTLAVCDLEDGRLHTIACGEQYAASVCGTSLVLTAVGKESDAFAVDPVAIASASASSGILLEDVPCLWRTTGAWGVQALGPVFLATGLGLVDATDGMVLVRDAELDRAGWVGSRVIAWSSRRDHATIFALDGVVATVTANAAQVRPAEVLRRFEPLVTDASSSSVLGPDMMRRFDRDEEAGDGEMGSKRLQAFTKAMWDTLVPAKGECRSVQGELIRANARLQGDWFQNGFGNYYDGSGDEADKPEDTFYGRMLAFLLDTLVANRSSALDASEVAYFVDVRGLVLPDWLRQRRISELEEKVDESSASDAEQRELEELKAAEGGLDWEDLFNRAERCIANWCIANPELVDRNGQPIEEGGVRRVEHVFNPPPPPPAPPPCPLCRGKGWLQPRNAGEFPEVCSCKRGEPAPERTTS